MTADNMMKLCKMSLRRGPNATSGFSLIEVCLAILVVGLGLLAVFSLFPSGLRSVEDDTADTRAGFFMESAMNGMRANAMTMNRAAWTNSAAFVDEVKKQVLVVNGLATPIEEGKIVPIRFPDNSGDYLRYRLTLTGTNSLRRGAVLEVEDGRYPNTFIFPSVCYTEFWYSGQ